jgi:hypothetical protein
MGKPKANVTGDTIDKLSTMDPPPCQLSRPPFTSCVSSFVSSLIVFPFLLIGVNIVEDFEVLETGEWLNLVRVLSVETVAPLSIRLEVPKEP